LTLLATELDMKRKSGCASLLLVIAACGCSRWG